MKRFRHFRASNFALARTVQDRPLRPIPASRLSAHTVLEGQKQHLPCHTGTDDPVGSISAENMRQILRHQGRSTRNIFRVPSMYRLNGGMASNYSSFAPVGIICGLSRIHVKWKTDGLPWINPHELSILNNTSKNSAKTEIISEHKKLCKFNSLSLNLQWKNEQGHTEIFGRYPVLKAR